MDLNCRGLTPRISCGPSWVTATHPGYVLVVCPCENATAEAVTLHAAVRQRTDDSLLQPDWRQVHQLEGHQSHPDRLEAGDEENAGDIQDKVPGEDAQGQEGAHEHSDDPR